MMRLTPARRLRRGHRRPHAVVQLAAKLADQTFFVLGEIRAQADPFCFTVQGRCGCLCYQGADGTAGAVFQVQRQAEEDAGDDIFLAWLGVGGECAVKAPWVLRSGQAVQGREYRLE